MQKNTYPGKFIVFEGLDGSGQTTQAQALDSFLLGKGYQVLLTKEPTLESEAGKRIREIVDGKTQTLPPQKLQELFTQDRAEHLQNTIIPALEKGTWVIGDRYFFSTFAYGSAEGADLEQLINQNNSFLYPDITFFLKVDPSICLERIQKRGKPQSIFEYKEKLEKTWKVYEKLAQRFENIQIINGEQSIEKVSENIQEVMTSFLCNTCLP